MNIKIKQAKMKEKEDLIKKGYSPAYLKCIDVSLASDFKARCNPLKQNK